MPGCFRVPLTVDPEVLTLRERGLLCHGPASPSSKLFNKRRCGPVLRDGGAGRPHRPAAGSHSRRLRPSSPGTAPGEGQDAEVTMTVRGRRAADKRNRLSQCALQSAFTCLPLVPHNSSGPAARAAVSEAGPRSRPCSRCLCRWFALTHRRHPDMRSVPSSQAMRGLPQSRKSNASDSLAGRRGSPGAARFHSQPYPTSRLWAGRYIILP